MEPLFALLILLVGIFVGFMTALLLRTERESDMEFANVLTKKKEENLEKLLKHFEKHSKATNDDVEKLLGVSDSTAYRYLEELEAGRKIRQVGKVGAGVYYEKI